MKNKRSSNAKKRSSLRRALTVILVCAAATALLLLLNAIPFDLLASRAADLLSPKAEETEPAGGMVQLCEPDWEADINDDAEYMAKSRCIVFTSGALSVKLYSAADIAATSLGSDAAFFLKFFDALKEGDAEALNSCFDEGYYAYEGAERRDKITMQRVYDISAELMSSGIIQDGDDAGATEYYFKVTYKIMKNDGSYRSDIPSDTAVAEQYRLIENASGIFIRYIGKMTQSTAK